MRMLIELQQNHGITEVMVTHEMALRDYANRVIWLRDGKISKVYTIDEKVRKKKIQKLFERTDKFMNKQENNPLFDKNDPKERRKKKKEKKRKINDLNPRYKNFILFYVYIYFIY
eukprot:Anaeramoba_flamelloidesc42895_g1_i6.p2 GENE.c42895_g1_i6~~c42895_g1_i6.p2  ORF type:complete len:115 (+),score=25.74 c42895_g1_i6:121-465(+)